MSFCSTVVLKAQRAYFSLAFPSIPQNQQAEKRNTPMELIQWSNVTAQEIEWLWHPYISKGKITIVQGDPGEGRTTFLLAIAAALTTGASLPGSNEALVRSPVIFQSAEDGIADTLLARFFYCSGRRLLNDLFNQ
jgi:RecA-family ATPase